MTLQRSAGNAAVVSLMGRAARPPMPQTHGGDAPVTVQTCGRQDPGCGCPPEEGLAAAAVPLQRETGAEAVVEHSSLLNLDEAALGARAAERVKAGDHAFMDQVLDELGSTDRDDVVYEVLLLLADADLDAMVAGDGNVLLTRMYGELTGGILGEDEQAQADRILQARSRAVGEAAFVAAAEGGATKIFPSRPPGLFVMDDAIINAEPRGEGRIWVEMPVRVFNSDTYAEDVATLPEQVFISGIEIPEDEIVGVRRYDLGGEVEYRPATYLLQVSNQTDTKTLETMGEAIAIGATLGSGELLALGYEASMFARVLLWADRAAFVIGLVTTALRDHRGWIISTFGDDGREFLKYVDLTHSAVAMYGMARAVIGAYQAFRGLREWHRNWTALRAADDASSARASDLAEIDEHIDELLETAESMRAARGGQDLPEGQPGVDLEPPPAPRGETDGVEAPPGVPRGAPELNATDQAFLDATADLTVRELTPTDIDRELDIAARLGRRSERGGTVVYDLPNGHSWELHPNGTMCRHSTLEHCLLFQSFPLESHIGRVLANNINIGQGHSGPLGNIRRQLQELNNSIRNGEVDLDTARTTYNDLARDVERVRPGTLDEMTDPAALTERMGQLQAAGRIAGGDEVTILGAPDVGHEGPQAVSYGRLQGGGTFEFGENIPQGIEGLFHPTAGGDPIPVSLKDFSFSDNMQGLLGNINRNANRIPGEHAGRVHVHVRVHQWTAEAVRQFIENGPILGMPAEGIFERLIFECADGVIVVTRGGAQAL